MDSPTPFDLHRAGTAAQAVALLAGHPGARFIAGGTDLLPNLRRGIGNPPALVDLGGIAGFADVARDAQGWRIGAGVTLARLAADGAIARELPALAQAASSVAGPGHRSVATLGGNLCQDTRCVFYNQSAWWRQTNGFCLKHGGDTCHVAPQGRRCHAAYSGDLAAALLALHAIVAVVGPAGERTLPLEQLHSTDGARPLTLGAAELVAAVRIPPQPEGSRSGYLKARVRGALEFPLAGVASRITAKDGRPAELRLALTGVAAHPVLLADTVDLPGRRLDETAFAALAKRIGRSISPVRTTVVSSQYRREMAVVLARRLLRQLLGDAHAAPEPEAAR